ncbi:helix-turn-helix transcriptional regulator [Enterobacter hormaechei]|uniref:helix-turn-helix transcriptional regulator n=1 Tax=Enterobacter hormaechei TaxID=158836 RepID=UPI0018695D80|nr:helix-turn-helix domain-containing protein [Enterobacter hormaechei]MBE2980777.1 helix-turn-helix domain-containing protein [Enterobacter hormaechei]MCU3599640.1 helix-turn-helix domain-containing protein [Enterobacter hormaechei subsp. hoffmannii]
MMKLINRSKQSPIGRRGCKPCKIEVDGDTQRSRIDKEEAMNQAEQLYKAREICQILKISRATFYRKVKRNEIDPPLKDGAMARWPESSIIKYQERLRERT